MSHSPAPVYVTYLYSRSGNCSLCLYCFLFLKFLQARA
jgi:hypothetical protein